MKIVNYAHGVSARRFAIEEAQPLVARPYQEITNAIQERYSFMNVGASSEAQQVGLLTPTFEQGQFVFAEAAQAIISLEIGPEGLRAASSTTEISDAFIADLLDFVQNEFGFRPQAIRKPPLYASTLLVEIDKDEQKIFAALERGAEILRELFDDLGKTRNVKPFGLRWMTQETTGASTICILEKRLGDEVGEDIYFSQASLPTTSHERYLRRLLEVAGSS